MRSAFLYLSPPAAIPPTLSPMTQASSAPPTICQELTAAGGHAAAQAGSPGTGQLGVFLAVAAELRKHSCVLPGDLGPPPPLLQPLTVT